MQNSTPNKRIYTQRSRKLQENKDILIKWIQKNGIKNKKLFEKKFPNIMFKDLKFQWKNVWNPALKKGTWTQEEDLMIFKFFIQEKGSWSKIADEIANRSRIAIRNRFRNTFRSSHFKQSLADFVKILLQKQEPADFESISGKCLCSRFLI